MHRKSKKEKTPTNPLDEELKKFKGAGLGSFHDREDKSDKYPKSIKNPSL
jgi:hypothetical protein